MTPLPDPRIEMLRSVTKHKLLMKQLPDELKAKLAYKWVDDCMRVRGRVLTGVHAHWCREWDGLPVDETCSEFPCGCSAVKPT